MAKDTKSAPKKAAAPKAAATPAPAAAAPLSAPAPAPGAQPAVRILAQYVKDLSFENPNAPASLAPQPKQPDINISVNVNARNLAPTDFEVELSINAKATLDGRTFFAAEVLYCGVFRMENFPQEILHPAVLIECPRMLFPFARQIIAEATRNGGYPPLMIDPIDFAGMYQKRMQPQGQA